MENQNNAFENFFGDPRFAVQTSTSPGAPEFNQNEE